VINIPTVDLVDQVVGIGNSTGGKLDKFKEFGLTAVAVEKVSAPLIKECYANFECRLADAGMIRAVTGCSSGMSSRPTSPSRRRTQRRCTIAVKASSWSRASR
jgi:hypothetical protein